MINFFTSRVFPAIWGWISPWIPFWTPRPWTPHETDPDELALDEPAKIILPYSVERAPADARAIMRGTIYSGPWEITRYECDGALAPWSYQDRLLIARPRHGDLLRLAAIDGVTPTIGTPSRVGVDGAVWGSAVVGVALQSPAEIEECLLKANHELLRPDLLPCVQSQACVVVADVAEDGSIRIVRGGDCEAWVLHNGQWRSIFPAAHREWAKKKWADYLFAHPHLMKHSVEIRAAEDMVWGDPAAWESHSVGRFEEPVFEVYTLAADEWDTLVLTTDGLGLREAAVEGAPQLIAELTDQDRAQDRLDTAVLVLQRRQHPGAPVAELAR